MGWKSFTEEEIVELKNVFTAEEAIGYEPVYFWQRIKRGASYILARLLIGWRQLTRKAVAGA